MLGIELKVLAVSVLHTNGETMFAIEIGLSPANRNWGPFAVGSLQEEFGLESEVATTFTADRSILTG